LKTCLAVSGVGRSGKTTTIRLLVELITALYPRAKLRYTKSRRLRDISLTIRVESKKIAVESRGDPNSDLRGRLAVCARRSFDVVVCATRLRGETVRAMLSLSASGYAISQFRKSPAIGPRRQGRENRALALTLLDEIRSLVDI
jgi:hypothetical protein